jgi:hypothetical protein
VSYNHEIQVIRLGARRFLILSEKDSRRDTGDLSKGSFINAKQSESTLSSGKRGQVQKEDFLEVLMTSTISWGLWTCGGRYS